MPHSDLHQKQKKKNLAMLGALLALFVLLFAITVMRLSGAK